MTIASLERAMLLLTMPERFRTAPASDIAQAFLVGLRFDVVVASMLAAPLALVAGLTPRWLIVRSPRVRVGLAVGAGALLGAFVFLSVVDYYFFRQFDQRLNHKALVYLSDAATYRIILDQWPVIPALAASVAAGFGATIALRPALAWAPDRRAVSALGMACWLTLTMPLLFLGIRNSTGPKGINQGPAFFGASSTVAQLTLNGAFTLREAVWSSAVRHWELARLVDTLPEDEAIAIARRSIATERDRFLDDPDNPMLRVTDTGAPERPLNVVLVMLESLSWHYVGAMGGDDRLTPNLDRLIDQGVFFDNCYAVGRRTTAGVAGIVCAHPDLPGESITTRPESIGAMGTLGSVLGARGYETMFVYAGQPMYDHRQAFLRSNGFGRMVFGDDFKSRTFRNHLGWSDEDLFTEADRQFRAMGDRPFFALLLTLSFHRPYTIPPGRIEPVDPSDPDSEKLDSIRYTDWAIGRFMERARESDYFDDTVFVFVADHMGDFRVAPTEPDDYRVPFLIYAPGVLGEEGRRVSTLASQPDVAPTIMGLLGGSYTHAFFGSDALRRSPSEGLAVFQDSDAYIGMIDPDGMVVKTPFHAPARLMRLTGANTTEPVDADTPALVARREEMARRAIAIVQAAETAFKRSRAGAIAER